MRNDFAAFILSHGRPDRVITYNTLRKSGYSGKIYIIIDNEDNQINKYQSIYKDQVVIFDKAAIAKTFDQGDNFNDYRSPVYARNACFDIARNLDLTYFVQLDDDYTHFGYRFANEQYLNSGPRAYKLDQLFNIILDYYISIDAASIAISQGGDFIGGSQGTNAKTLRMLRKSMNSFFCSIERQFAFTGRLNDDVNTYITHGNRGLLFFTILQVCLEQCSTQQHSGGITEAYLDYGTYIKSFYTVMYAPSCSKVYYMKTKYSRLHHNISWNNAVPKIIKESYRL